MFRGDIFAALRGFAVLLAVALLLALLAAVACGDGDQDGGETPAAPQTPAADQTPEGGEMPEADGGEEGLQELEAFVGQAIERLTAVEGLTAKVTYRASSESMSGSAELELVMVQRPPDYRFEVVSREGGEEKRSVSIIAGGNAYGCAPGQSMCAPLDVSDALSVAGGGGFRLAAQSTARDR